MRVKWLGHSCFLLTSDNGTKVITDPYAVQGGLNYGKIDESADIVLSSHDHFDHSNVAAVKGKTHIIRGAGDSEAKGVRFKGILAYHDDAKGMKRGDNTIFAFELDGLRVCHLGDLGHELSDAALKEIGKVDILFVPIGGLYTFEVDVATRVCNKLASSVIIPMHFKTPKVDTVSFGEITGPDDFLKGKSGVARRKSSEAQFDAGNLPASVQVVVLKPAL